MFTTWQLVPGHEDNSDLRHQAVDHARKFQAVNGSRHVDVGEDGFNPFAVGEHWHRLIGARRFRYHIAGVF